MINESVKKSLEKSKNVLEEKRKIVKRQICIKKDKHVYNNCYELRSRAIKNKMRNILSVSPFQVSFLWFMYNNTDFWRIFRLCPHPT